MRAAQTESQNRPREAVVAGLPAGYNEMRTAKFYIFCSLSATKLQGMVAVGDVVVVVVVRQTAGHGGLR